MSPAGWIDFVDLAVRPAILSEKKAYVVVGKQKGSAEPVLAGPTYVLIIVDDSAQRLELSEPGFRLARFHCYTHYYRPCYPRRQSPLVYVFKSC